MDGITFSLVPVADEISPNRKVYRAIVKTNGTIDKEALAKALAEKTGQDISLANYFLDALNEILAKEIVAGYRVNLGQLSTGFSIKGSFTSEDDRFDPKRHSVQPTVQALEPLKSALAAVGADNITVGLTCRLGSLMDFVTKALNEITGTHEVHIEGERIGIDTENADEHVHLLKDDGTSKGTVEMRGPSGGDAVEYYFHEGVDVGDTVKVVLHIDPEKTEFDPNDVSREATVTE